MPHMRTYYIHSAGATTGPFQLDQIIGMWKVGKIPADATAEEQGTKQTFRVSEMILTSDKSEKKGIPFHIAIRTISVLAIVLGIFISMSGHHWGYILLSAGIAAFVVNRLFEG